MKVHRIRVRTFCRFFAVSGSCFETWWSDATDMVTEPFRGEYFSLPSGTGTLIGVGVGESSAGIVIGGTSKVTAGTGTNSSNNVLGAPGVNEGWPRGGDFKGSEEGTCRELDEGSSRIIGRGKVVRVTGCSSCPFPCFSFWRCFLSRRARRLAFFIADLVNFGGSCSKLTTNK